MKIVSFANYSFVFISYCIVNVAIDVAAVVEAISLLYFTAVFLIKGAGGV